YCPLRSFVGLERCHHYQTPTLLIILRELLGRAERLHQSIQFLFEPRRLEMAEVVDAEHVIRVFYMCFHAGLNRSEVPQGLHPDADAPRFHILADLLHDLRMMPMRERC